MRNTLDSTTVAREEVVEWLRRRVAELEAELRMLKAVLSMLEGGGGLRPGERVEEVKVGRRRVARLYRGEGYLRLVPDFPMALTSEARGYLEEVIEEIAERQAREGVEEDERARLEVRTGPDGAVTEIMVAGLHGTIDYLKARAALKYAAEHAYEIYRMQRRASPGGEL